MTQKTIKQREIKFRAWDGQKMYFTDHGDIGRTRDGEFEWSPYCFVIDWPQIIGSPDVDTWKVMQYTDVKDRNNSDIYEGDIVQFPASDKTAKVIFKEGRFLFTTDGKSDFGIGSNCKVIGNIYENPELLK